MPHRQHHHQYHRHDRVRYEAPPPPPPPQGDLKDYLKRDLGITPKNLELYETAFCHRSYAHEQGLPPHATNERLEFLGDSVLGLILAEYLFSRYTTSEEGDISKMKAQLGSRQTLAEVSRRLNLSDYLRVGRGEARAGTQDLPSLSSNVFEALLGALYLDRGYEAARAFTTHALAPEFETDLVSQDYKSVLQEFAQRRFHTAPFYQVVRTSGPEHRKTFDILTRINGKVYGRGRGHTKKEAEQDAAHHTLRRFGVADQPTPGAPRPVPAPVMAPPPPARRWWWPFGGRARS